MWEELASFAIAVKVIEILVFQLISGVGGWSRDMRMKFFKGNRPDPLILKNLARLKFQLSFSSFSPQ